MSPSDVFPIIFNLTFFRLGFTSLCRLVLIFISSPNILQTTNISRIFLVFPLENCTIFVHSIFKYSLYARRRELEII